MGILTSLEEHGHEQIFFFNDRATKFRCVAAIHNTTLGPALAGVRMWNYRSEEDAVEDVLKISRSISYGAAFAGCDLGGGGVVLWGESTDKSEVYFRLLGKVVERMNGQILLASDVGVSHFDMVHAKRETEYVSALPEIQGGSGDSAFFTAYGLYWGIKAAIKELFGHFSLEKCTIAIQGAGKVGCHLVELLEKEEKGIRILITDIDYDKIKNIQDRFPKIQIVEPDEIISSKCDVFSPCALGDIFHQDTLKNLNCKIIVGGADNLFVEEKLIEDVHKKGILYVPAFVTNAGWLLQVADELIGFNRERTLESCRGIFDRVGCIVTRAKKEGRTPHSVALEIAQKRIADVGRIKPIYV